MVAENSATKFFQETSSVYRGQQFPFYLMNRDGFSLLAMGFTGKKALQWKLKYIEAFNEMEETLKQGDLEEPVNQNELHCKTYKGVPVITIGDFAEIVKRNRISILWHLKDKGLPYQLLEKEEVTAYKNENNIPMHSAVSRLIVFTEPTAYKLTCIMYNNVDPINLEIAKYFNRQPVATVKSVVPIEEKIGIDYDSVKAYIEEMETNISLMRGMVKHLTEFKRTREEHKYQMKLNREIGCNIFDGTGDLEKAVNNRI
ncbi:MAG: Rha family transcriptional regulator [Veillonella caviae]|uniref:Rha family transcriptional regulator n=1 Tax=Veillonella caviae TaxID=248316 RepID=UPI002A912E7B|nr:Rha family transcriptional regulator [Veillonella caviae]MDY5481880.1 Rha family transcriptional regulator [Veillonella caviae]